MCGIIGLIGSSDTDWVAAAAGFIAHRGPDSFGFFADGNLGFSLAHQRLKIVDSTDGGLQPMISGDERFIMVFNGEIYNYRELAVKLMGVGIDVRGQGDSRVLLEGYRVWGRDVVAMLRGMFAFLMIDLQGGDDGHPFVLVARDRLGIKPLYIGKAAGGVGFSSEVLPFVKANKVPRSLDLNALRDCVRYGSLLDGGVVVSGIHEQLPATLSEFGAEGAIIDRRSYWMLGETGAVAAITNQRSCVVATIREHLDRIGHEQMAPESRAGLMLSGGIDSSIVAALAKRHGNYEPIAVSIGSRGTVLQTDVEHARIVAERLKIELIERWVEDHEVESLVDDWLGSVDQPSGDGFNSFIASRTLAPHCKVVLSGLGADELFGGYPHFFPTTTPERTWRQWASAIYARFVMRRKAQEFGPRWSSQSPEHWVAKCRTIADPMACLNPGLLKAANADGSSHSHEVGGDFFQRVSRAEILGYLRGILLRDADAMSMASSLELRPPFLDHLLVDYVYMLPQSMKVVPGRLKPLLVDACVDLLDPIIVARKKTGFSLPYGKWMQGPLHRRALHTFGTPLAKKIFSPAYLDQLKSELKIGAGATFRTWSHWVLLEWCLRNQISVDD